MRSFLKKHVLIFLSVLFLGLSFVLWYSFVIHKQKHNDKTYIETVSSKLETELAKVKVESEALKSTIEKCSRPTFSKLIHTSDYPYFVFRNNYLYFWSDNNLVPKQELVSNSRNVSYVAQKSGKYIVHRDFLIKRGDLFEIFYFIPLKSDYAIENDYLNSRLNSNIFGNSIVSISNHPSAGGGSIYTSDGQYLFSITFPDNLGKSNNDILPFILLFSGIGIFLLVLYLINLTNLLSTKIGSGNALLFLLGSLFFIRWVMLTYNYPFHLIEYDLFNSKFFASSNINPSLGDLILNLIFFCVFGILLLKHYSRTSPVRYLIRSGTKKQGAISFGLLLLCFFSLYYIFDLMLVLFMHGQWQVDITESIDFGFLRLSSLLAFGLLFTIFLIFSFLFSKLLLYINRRKKGLFSLFLFAFILFASIIYFTDTFYWPVILIDALFFAVVLYFELPKLSLKPKYGSYFYLLLSGLACALIAAYGVYVFNKKTDISNKQRFASQLLVENDVLGEYLLNEASFYIKNDPFIHSRILNPFSSKEAIVQKIKKVYLGEYFDKYDVKVHLFDALGRAYRSDQEFLFWQEVVNKYRLSQFSTDYSDIFLMFDPGKRGFKRYLSFNKIRKNGVRIGYILVELRQKRATPHSVYPELLVDKRFVQPWEGKSYNYVIYGDNEIKYSYGQFNYEKNFPLNLLNKSQNLFDQGITIGGYHHYALKGEEGKVVVVSSAQYPFQQFFSNFSFLFIVLMFIILIFVVIWSVNFRLKNIDANFSTKIQIYLNLAFFLPLFIVSITTLSIIASTYKENLNKSFIKKAEAVSTTINMYLEGEDGKPSKTKLENLLVEKSRFLETDINLYDNKGRLLFSNQPLIFEAGLLSPLINPKAYSTIQDNKNNVFMLSEKVGDLNYNSVYIAIKSYESGDLIGILSIPFFESKQELDKQLVEVLTTIINIFVCIFLVFLLLSSLVTKLLTVPLDIITQKLKRTSLSEKNEPLEWYTKDEIGLLVGEYNRMLVKLEESKTALSRSEKESAWREMAQQVAHEIKNPLTPMKLSIQHLQRAIKDKRDNLQEMGEKSLLMLLDQVDNLNEIATSFSVFAKMPIPKNERFELSAVVQKIARLHSADKNIQVKTVVEKNDFYVIGDEQLMGNILSNLIINAAQSVSGDKEPFIEVNLTQQRKSVLLSVADNGEGIPEDIREKVFVPNFSTKYTGSGLGLAIAKRGVEHAGGSIWFETMEGQGTTFFIELPLTD